MYNAKCWQDKVKCSLAILLGVQLHFNTYIDDFLCFDIDYHQIHKYYPLPAFFTLCWMHLMKPVKKPIGKEPSWYNFTIFHLLHDMFGWTDNTDSYKPTLYRWSLLIHRKNILASVRTTV